MNKQKLKEMIGKRLTLEQQLTGKVGSPCMYCPEHDEEYAHENNPFSNSICGRCGTRKPSHYKKYY